MKRAIAVLILLCAAAPSFSETVKKDSGAYCAYKQFAGLYAYAMRCDASNDNILWLLDGLSRKIQNYLLENGNFTRSELDAFATSEAAANDICHDPALRDPYREFVTRFTNFFEPLAIDFPKGTKPVRGTCLP
ncbi:hypothetical protein [Tateyamaria sp.]|uniref:hypothetical protein n=1 Tax=Tateyamaria sp. TaxID=1929288 RepID=UPI003B2251C1